MARRHVQRRQIHEPKGQRKVDTFIRSANGGSTAGGRGFRLDAHDRED